MKIDYLEELSNLKLQRKYLVRQLDVQNFTKDGRTYIFKKIDEVDKKIELTKFKLELLRRETNDKYRKKV